MNRQPLTLQPPRWDARLSPLWVRLTRGQRRYTRIRHQRLMEIETEGLEHLRGALERGAGVMITPNHCSHADPHAIYGAADAAGTPLYIMTCWQSFAKAGRVMKWIYQHNGCFSIGREGTDMGAVRRAIQILNEAPQPLVVFPEGEVYHLNDRLTPFREGPAVIALTAARHARRPILIVPCAMKYQYIQDPTPELEAVMDELECWIHWRPRRDLGLVERVYRFAEAGLGLKEMEAMGRVQTGTLPERVARLRDHVMESVERHYGLAAGDLSVPERIKQARRACLEAMERTEGDPARIAAVERQLEDIFLTVQLTSYPGNYVAERPTVERLAETIDKFEEDLLGLRTARIRGARKVRVRFGAPIDVGEFARTAAQPRACAPELTRALEEAVQAMLNAECGIQESGDRSQESEVRIQNQRIQKVEGK